LVVTNPLTQHGPIFLTAANRSREGIFSRRGNKGRREFVEVVLILFEIQKRAFGQPEGMLDE
jgi:hypothetical protein